MAAEPTVKRLRVRLRATDRQSLVESFGENFDPSGVFLRSSQVLSVGTPILLELLYQNGDLALRGRGEVGGVSSHGMNLAVSWAEETRALADWILDQTGPVAVPEEPSDDVPWPPDATGEVEAPDDPFEDVTVFAGDGPPDAWMQQAQESVSNVEAAQAPAPPEPPPVSVRLPLEPITEPAQPTEPPRPLTPPSVEPTTEPAQPPLEPQSAPEIPMMPPAFDQRRTADLAPDQRKTADVKPKSAPAPEPEPSQPEPLAALESNPAIESDPFALEQTAFNADQLLAQMPGVSSLPPEMMEPDLGVQPAQAAAFEAPDARPNSDGAWDLISDLLDDDVPSTPPSVPPPTAPPPTAPPPPVLSPESGDMPTSGDIAALKDAFDADSSDLERAAPIPQNFGFEHPSGAYQFGKEASHSGEFDPNGVREPGEVTPLARIELISPTNKAKISSAEVPVLELEDEEEGDKPSPTAIPSKQLRPVLPPKSTGIMAIDLGSSTVWAAVPAEGEVKIVESRRGTESFPSVVMIRDSGKTIIGEPAQRKVTAHPHSAVLDTRRLVGMPFESASVQAALSRIACRVVPGEERETAVRVGPYTISLEEIAALLLKEVRESTLMVRKEKINRAVLTCPASFGHRRRDGLLIAAELAGLHVESLVSESVAAAVHYAADRGLRNRTLFVYRLGGGTFDATVLHVDRDRYDVLATEGDAFLGGAEFDEALSALVCDEVARTSGMDPRSDPRAMAEVGEAVRGAKPALSANDSAQVYVEPSFGGETSFRFSVEVTRDQVDLLWAPLVQRTIDLSMRALASAKLSSEEIDDVIIVGGQTLAPIVQRRVREVLGKRPVDLDPVRAAVLGAGQIAARLDQPNAFSINEGLAQSIDVRIGERVEPLLAQGVTLPAQQRITLQPSDAIKGRVELVVLEGRDDRYDPAGVIRVEPVVTPVELLFSVSEQGLVEVSGFDADLPFPVKMMTDLSGVSGQAGVVPGRETGLFGWLKKRLRGSRSTAEK